jgi:Tol biopolymer transport system component
MAKGDAPNYYMEVALDGTGLHRLLPGWSKPPDSECCARWTADGKYFVFAARNQIWALPRKAGLLRSEVKPIQLTFSPIPLTQPIPSKDGTKLYVVGTSIRGELLRYDAKSKQFAPLLGGISSEFVDFSRDGQWVTYVSYPEGTLWRSKVDGSERLQLTYPPLYALMPRWSPDAKEIDFFETVTGRPDRIYAVSREGGTPRVLMPDDRSLQHDPNWSPDGTKLVFGGASRDPASDIRIFDLATHQISTVPGSQRLMSPRWSPDGRSLAAVSVDQKRLLVFDFQTQRWSEMTSGAVIDFHTWSKDGQFLYFLRQIEPGAVVRIRISDRKLERLLELKNIALTGHWGHWMGLSPDDSPLLLRNAGTQDVYALDWEEP